MGGMEILPLPEPKNGQEAASSGVCSSSSSSGWGTTGCGATGRLAFPTLIFLGAVKEEGKQFEEEVLDDFTSGLNFSRIFLVCQ